MEGRGISDEKKRWNGPARISNPAMASERRECGKVPDWVTAVEVDASVAAHWRLAAVLALDECEREG